MTRQEAIERIADLDAKIQFLVDYMNDNGLLEDGSFTFPDGETWEATSDA